MKRMAIAVLAATAAPPASANNFLYIPSAMRSSGAHERGGTARRARMERGGGNSISDSPGATASGKPDMFYKRSAARTLMPNGDVEVGGAIWLGGGTGFGT